jgi:hypothetical protein
MRFARSLTRWDILALNSSLERYWFAPSTNSTTDDRETYPVLVAKIPHLDQIYVNNVHAVLERLVIEVDSGP